VVWTTVPATRYHLWRQRERWRRNVIKICISKHRDLFVLGRYGFANAVVALQILFSSLLTPLSVTIAVFWAIAENGPLDAPQIIVRLYWMVLACLLIRASITHHICNTPKLANFWLVFLYPFYFFFVVAPAQYHAEVAELLRIGAKHPYVPDHVWEEIPWW